MKKFLTFPLCFFLLLYFTRCEKSPAAGASGVPNVGVNITENLNYASMVNLTVPMGYVVVTGGYLNHGIIIFNAGNGIFYAMDATCTYNNQDAVEIESNGIYAKCPDCNSVWLLPSGGTVDKGPASVGLKNYNASYDPDTGILTVTN